MRGTLRVERLFGRWVRLAALWGFLVASAVAQTGLPQRHQIQVGQSKFSTNPIALDATLWRPRGVARPPLMVWNHGDLPTSPKPATKRAAVRGGPYVTPFVEAGYAVLVFSRRGVGHSTGEFRPKAAQGCAGLVAGSEMEDLTAVMRYAREVLRDVDATRITLAGQSAGGLLALGYASKHPAQVRRVINFAGGWAVGGCSNKALYADLGRGFAKPSLWLYADGDKRHRPEAVRERLGHYNIAGGRAKLLTLAKPPNGDGHAAYQFPELWRKEVFAFMDAS